MVAVVVAVAVAVAVAVVVAVGVAVGVMVVVAVVVAVAVAVGVAVAVAVVVVVGDIVTPVIIAPKSAAYHTNVRCPSVICGAVVTTKGRAIRRHKKHPCANMECVTRREYDWREVAE